MNKLHTAVQDILAILRPFPHALARQEPKFPGTRAHYLRASSALYELPQSAAALLSTDPARARAALPFVTALLRRADPERPVTGDDRSKNPMHVWTTPWMQALN